MAAIAREAGVSTSTVSRALSGQGRLSEVTRRKVLDTAQSLGYRPNLLASSLRSQRTATLGVVVPDLVSPFFAHVLQGIECAAQEKGYSLLLSCSSVLPEKERDLVDLLLQKAVDGLLLFPAQAAVNRGFYGDLLAGGTPLVFVDRGVPGVEADLVASDNVLGGRLAAEHLLGLGRRRCVFLTTPSGEREATCVEGRLSGFTEALCTDGARPPVLVGSGVPDTFPEERFGFDAVARHLRLGEPFDALFASNDSLAFGAIRALAEAGRRVPEDVAVIGFDDKDASAYFRPALTTVRQPMRRMGEVAVEVLLQRLSDAHGACRRVLLEPELLVRESCGAAQGWGPGARPL